MIRRLIDHGANVNSVDMWGEVPLYYAVKYRHHSIVNLLLSHGAMWGQISDRFSRTPAVEGNREDEICLEIGPPEPSVRFVLPENFSWRSDRVDDKQRSILSCFFINE
jgi:ankyrin repeat protein